MCFNVHIVQAHQVGPGHAIQGGQEAGHVRLGDPHAVGDGHALHGGLGLARLQGGAGHALQVAKVGVPCGV